MADLTKDELAVARDKVLETLIPKDEKVKKLQFGVTEEGPPMEKVSESFSKTNKKIREIEERVLGPKTEEE